MFFWLSFEEIIVTGTFVFEFEIFELLLLLFILLSLIEFESRLEKKKRNVKKYIFFCSIVWKLPRQSNIPRQRLTNTIIIIRFFIQRTNTPIGDTLLMQRHTCVACAAHQTGVHGSEIIPRRNCRHWRARHTKYDDEYYNKLKQLNTVLKTNLLRTPARTFFKWGSLLVSDLVAILYDDRRGRMKTLILQ